MSSVFRNPAPVEDEDSSSINSDPEAKVRAHKFVLHILQLFKENNLQGTYCVLFLGNATLYGLSQIVSCCCKRQT